MKLDGVAESLLGDVLYSAAERYFLLEIKGFHSDLSTEWRGVDGEGQKLAYKSLAAMWLELETLCSAPQDGTSKGHQSDEDADRLEYLRRFFVASFSCHHFAYWDEWKVNNERFGEIVLESYVPACSRLFDVKIDAAGDLIKPWPSNYFGFITGAPGKELISDVVGIADIFDKVVSVAFSPDGKLGRKAFPVGLDIKSFQNYVTELVRFWGDDQQEIYAVILSSSGSFFRIIGSTGELKMVLEPGSDLYSSPRKSLRPLTSVGGGFRAKKLP